MSMHDLSKYQRYVEHLDLSQSEKTDLLRALWSILENFVDREFGEDSVQQAQRNTAPAGDGTNLPPPVGNSSRERAGDDRPVIDSQAINKQQATQLAGDFENSSRRGGGNGFT